ncbi:MAG: hypothetical protein Q4D99_00095 [Bacillota bacterium]|nr:hypothetical protein [Bacillota bacterium]
MSLFDFTDPGFLGYMESEGCMNTNEGLISRVAKVLNESPNDTIDTAEFRAACVSAGVDPDSFTQVDLNRLQQKLK